MQKVDVDTIVVATGLSKEEINKLTININALKP